LDDSREFPMPKSYVNLGSQLREIFPVVASIGTTILLNTAENGSRVGDARAKALGINMFLKRAEHMIKGCYQEGLFTTPT
jgi:hypothetical protein